MTDNLTPNVCGCCGQPLRRTTYPALLPHQCDKIMLDCLTITCPRYMITRDARSYATTDWAAYTQPARQASTKGVK